MTPLGAIAVWFRGVFFVAVLACLCWFLSRCTAGEVQTESCMGQIDARMLAEATTRCKGYQWDSCPYKEEIVKKYQEERHRCP